MLASRNKLYVDTRWSGQFGIGRYANEVIRQLTLPWVPLRGRGTPTSPQDLLTPRATSRNSLIYSPGFNAGFSWASQVVTVHDLIHLESGSVKHKFYYERILRPSVLKAGTVFTVSKTSRNALLDWFEDENVSIIDTGNGVSEGFRPGHYSGRWGEEYLLFVGNMKPHKNVALLLKMLKLSPERNLIAVVPDAAEFNRAADAAGVLKQIEVLTGIDDEVLCDLYRGASATIFPSTHEGFGLPAAESLCVGTPVVYWAGCKSVAEIVGKNGVAVESSTDAEEWTEALTAITRLSTSISSSFQIRYSWESVAKIVQNTLANLQAVNH